ncbi:MAG: glycoside hydrolase family 15 protein, partial [Syntrophobacteraceae bacterium]|nr:glycoside hydrolase family 15 protein [Syntrophobacteraceae bacterium]
MPRDIPLGNGRLLICFDKQYRIRDLYFPHVGQENHLSGSPCRMGVFVDGRFSWVGGDWKRELLYEDDTLVTRVDLYHPELALLITCRGAVDFHENIYVREIQVENLLPHTRQVKLFFTHDLSISGNSIGDTAAFDPASGGVVHYKGSRYFLFNGMTHQAEGLSQFAVGVKNVGGREGTFRDAEDGELSGNPIAQGSVDSVIALHLDVDGHSSAEAAIWMCAGEDWNEVRRLNALVRHKHPRVLIRRTGDYWKLWVRKEPTRDETLKESVERLYKRSLLVLHTQIDWQGGIIAGNDSDVIAYNRDTYSYVWPRDAALVANALDLAGYPAPSRKFFEFAASVMEEGGYFLHKYNPDGSLASSWHPWIIGSEEQLPIQEDETALVIWALWQHFVLYREIDAVKPLYKPLIKRAADFMVRYRDAETGLPGPSYDLWEERRGILTFTVAAVFGGLTAASLFCEVFGEEERARKYRNAASEIRDGAS